MSKLLAMLLVATGLCLLPHFSTAADKADAPPKVKEKEKTKPKEKESTVEWTEIKTKKGTLKKPEYVKGQPAKKAELEKLEFSSEAAAFRVKWTTKTVEGKRGGAMSLTLYKKAESRGNSDKENFKRAANLGNARGDSEGSSKLITTGKGDYYVEIEGDALEYEITVEGAEKKETSAAK